MLITTTFFTGLNQIELSATSQRGEGFADLYYLTTDPTRIREVVVPFADALGNIEISYLTGGGAKALVYRTSKQEIDEADIASSLNRLLIEDMATLNRLQYNLWIVKDNAAHFDRCWITAAPNPMIPIFNNNTWESRQSCADGSYQAIHFDIEELRGARLISNGPASHIGTSQTSTMLTNESLRYSRFSYFVNASRSTRDVAMKIAEYCSGLEALVSTAQTELSHQVSERVAAALTPPGEKRIALFKQVKEAYGFRSRAVHGATFKLKDTERLRECAKLMDQVCRDLVLTYFDPGTGFRAAIEKSEQATTEFFINRVLGSESRFTSDEGEHPTD
jgi:hypothetical protein